LKIRRYLRRLGCGIALVLWFTFLLTPCVMVVLATQHEIILTHSDIPQDDFRIWLIQSIGQRGIGVANSRRVSAADGNVCTIIDGFFVLWEGKPASSTHYCSCYQKQDYEWVSTAEGAEACQIAEK
jgi:hypothetical protein